MDMIIEAGLFVAGLLLLLKGASVFTENSSRIAKEMGVSDVVIGLTLVAFTTSLPELAVSVASVLTGSSGLAVGNVIGSNIANIGLVLGLSALLTPGIRSSKNELKQAYIMLLVTIASVMLILDGMTPIKGLLLVSALIFYVLYLYRDPAMQENIVEKIIEKGSVKKSLLFCLLGAGGVLVGAQVMVSSSTGIAEAFGVPEVIIGLTIVAVGTSLPELATSLAAALKRLEGIALGNIIGSNIFNLLMVLGASSVVGPLTIGHELLSYSLPMMLLLALLLVVLMRVENRLGRLDGLTLLALYIFFLYLKFFP